MFNNYQYFITLAEELNMTRAASKLHISHQCLSKFLKRLESEYETILIDRKPVLSLTYAGELLLKTLRNIEILENNFNNQISELSHGHFGELRIGTTEGRMRLLMPDLLYEFNAKYPNVNLRIISNKTNILLDMLVNNKLDIALMSSSIPIAEIHYDLVLKEQLYVVISDNLMDTYFKEMSSQYKEDFKTGADLKLFEQIPFVLSYQELPSRKMIDKHLIQIGSTVNCVSESSAMDLHHIMTSKDYAASLCLTMFLSNICKLNDTSTTTSKLNVFPIKDFEQTNPIAIAYRKDKFHPEFSSVAMKMIREICKKNCISNFTNVETI